MKRVLAALLTAALILCLCACGQEEIPAFRSLETMGSKHYAAICRLDDRIAPVIGAALQELAANGSLSAVCSTWLGQDRIELDGVSGALAALDELPEPRKLIFGVEGGFNPMAFERDGQLQGMSVDIAQAVGALLGWEVQLLTIAPAEVATQLSSGNIDCALGFDTALVSAEHYSVGTPYLKSDIVLAVRGESPVRRMKDLRDQRVGIVNDPSVLAIVKSHEKLGKYASGATEYLSATRCITALDKGWCAAVVMDSIMLTYFQYN